MMRVRGARAALALVLGLGLVAAACSNDPDTESSGEDTEAGGDQFADLEPIEAPSPCEEDPGVDGNTIKVGLLAPQSGPSATSFASSEAGVRARIDKANQTGELGDYQLELVVADDAGDPGRNLTAAQQLVEQEGVFGVIEVSSAADGSGQYLDDEGVPVTGWHVGSPVWGTHTNMFPWHNVSTTEAERQTTRNADVLEALGASKVAIVAGGNESSVTFAEDLEETVDANPDLEVVYTDFGVPSGTTQFTGQVAEIGEAGADGMYTGMDFVSNAALSEQLAQAGVDVPVTIFPGGYDPRVTGLPGVEGAYFGVEFRPLELNEPVHDEYRQYAGDNLGQVPIVGWISADTMIEGIKEAGVECPTREAFINNLRLVEDYDAGGFLDPPTNFREEFGVHFQCVYYVQVDAGAFVPQFDGEPFCGEVFAAEGTEEE
jgi:branched-chain amino acid transport system substrate-binding protein